MTYSEAENIRNPKTDTIVEEANSLIVVSRAREKIHLDLERLSEQGVDISDIIASTIERTEESKVLFGENPNQVNADTIIPPSALSEPDNQSQPHIQESASNVVNPALPETNNSSETLQFADTEVVIGALEALKGKGEPRIDKYLDCMTEHLFNNSLPKDELGFYIGKEFRKLLSKELEIKNENYLNNLMSELLTFIRENLIHISLIRSTNRGFQFVMSKKPNGLNSEKYQIFSRLPERKPHSRFPRERENVKKVKRTNMHNSNNPLEQLTCIASPPIIDTTEGDNEANKRNSFDTMKIILRCFDDLVRFVQTNEEKYFFKGLVHIIKNCVIIEDRKEGVRYSFSVPKFFDFLKKDTPEEITVKKLVDLIEGIICPSDTPHPLKTYLKTKGITFEKSEMEGDMVRVMLDGEVNLKIYEMFSDAKVSAEQEQKINQCLSPYIAQMNGVQKGSHLTKILEDFTKELVRYYDMREFLQLDVFMQRNVINKFNNLEENIVFQIRKILLDFSEFLRKRSLLKGHNDEMVLIFPKENSNRFEEFDDDPEEYDSFDPKEFFDDPTSLRVSS